MTPGLCAHCLQFKNLCNSHAIPNAVFRRLFKTPGGAISLVDDETTPNRYSTDSWAWPILCENCEAEFEKRFDGFGVGFLLAKIGTFQSVVGGVRISGVDQARLTEFFVSVAWRAAMSGHDAYSKLKALSADHVQVLRDGITGRGPLPHVMLSRLIDGAGEMPRSVMREVTVTPVVYEADGMVTIFSLYSGFLIGVFVTRPKIKMRQSMFFLKSSSKNAPFFVRDYEFEKYRPVINLMMKSVGKEYKGLTRLER